jgi:hypothetical protein
VSKRGRASAAELARRNGRTGSHFLLIPYEVQDSPGWLMASHTAISLLLDMLRSGPPGRLSATMTQLNGRGWKSDGTIARNLKVLIKCGLIVRTRAPRGRNGRECALYACTWQEIKPEARKGLQLAGDPASAYTAHLRLYLQHDRPGVPLVVASSKKKKCAPSEGARDPRIALSEGARPTSHPPSEGALRGVSAPFHAPSEGVPLEQAISSAAPEGVSRGVSPAHTRVGRLLAMRCTPLGTRPEAYGSARQRFQPAA